MEPLVFGLERIVEPADLEITLRDAVSGQQVGGARVILAEAWPLGEIAAATSGPDGRVAFSGLKLGRINWADAEDRLAVARRRATVRIQKEGYEPAVHLVSLRAGAAAEIEVNPESEIVEREPNGELATAQPIRSGAPVRFQIATRDDVEFFALRLDEPAHLRIEVGPKNPIQIEVVVFDGAGKRVTSKGTHAGHDHVIARGFFAGQVYIRVTEWGCDAASEETLTLRVTRQTAADPLEPNDTAAQARLIRSGEEIGGTILPRANVDHYRFELSRPGTVRFTMPPHPLQREVVVCDESGKRLASEGVHAKQPLTLHRGLDAGRYVVRVQEWGNDAESPEPYRLRFDFAEDDGVRDPPAAPGRVTAVRSLELGALVGATINPHRDYDLYAVPLDRSGLLRLQARASTQIEVLVLDSTGKRLTSKGTHARQPLELLWSAPGPTIAYVLVREWGDDVWSPLPYTLRALWEPCDELEAQGRNDRLEWATPVEPGDVLRGSIAPYRDADYYRLDLDHPGYLGLTGSGPTQLHGRILDRDMKVLAAAGAHAGHRLALGADVQAGPVFVEITEWGNDGTQVGAYTVATSLRRAERGERRPLAEDPIRTLRLGEARAFSFDHLRDRDRFFCDVPQAGKVWFKLRSPTQVELVIFDDRTNAKLTSFGLHGDVAGQQVLEAQGPTRYRLELSEWGNDARSAEPGCLMVDQVDRPLVAEKIRAVIEPTDPTRVTFSRETWKGSEEAGELQIDGDGDGRVDLAVPPRGSAVWRAPSEGHFAATALLVGAGGQRSVQELWVDARGPRERKGVHVIVQYPVEGQVIETDEPCRVGAISYTGVPVQRVVLSLGGRPLASAYAAPYLLEVPWQSLGGGEHELAFAPAARRSGARSWGRTPGAGASRSRTSKPEWPTNSSPWARASPARSEA